MAKLRRSFCPQRFRGKTLTAAIVFTAIFTALPGGGFPEKPPPPDSSFAVIPGEGKTAPDFRLPDLAGKTHSPGDYRGKVLLIHFWASWCRPCEKEMPALIRLNELLRDRGFVILAIAVDSEKRVKPYAERWGLSFPVLIDGFGAAMRAYGIKAIPSSVAVGRDGAVRGVMVGERDYAGPEALKFFESLLEEQSEGKRFP